MTRITDERLAELAKHPARTWLAEVQPLVTEVRAWREAATQPMALAATDCTADCATRTAALLSTAHEERDAALAAADDLRAATELVKTTTLMGYTARDAIVHVAEAITRLNATGLRKENARLTRELHRLRDSARGQEEQS